MLLNLSVRIIFIFIIIKVVIIKIPLLLCAISIITGVVAYVVRNVFSRFWKSAIFNYSITSKQQAGIICILGLIGYSEHLLYSHAIGKSSSRLKNTEKPSNLWPYSRDYNSSSAVRETKYLSHLSVVINCFALVTPCRNLLIYCKLAKR